MCIRDSFEASKKTLDSVFASEVSPDDHALAADQVEVIVNWVEIVHDLQSQAGRIAKDEVTLGYATCLGLEVMKNLTPIDYNLNLISGESLVVRRDLAGEDRIQSLLTCLKERVALKAAEYEELTLCF